MKFSSVAVVATIAAAASAQTLSGLPPCALNCFANLLPSTSCSINDLPCACSDTRFVSGSAACIRGGCPPTDQQRALSAAAALCSANGVNIPSTFPSSAPATTAASTTSAALTTTQTAGTTTFALGSTGLIPTTLPTTTAFAGNGTFNATRPTSTPGAISSGAERLTTALGLVGLSIAAAYFSL